MDQTAINALIDSVLPSSPPAGARSIKAEHLRTLLKLCLGDLLTQQQSRLLRLPSVASLASVSEDEIQSGGTTWIKEAGAVAANTPGYGGVLLPGPAGFRYRRKIDGPLLPEMFGAKSYPTEQYFIKETGTNKGYYLDAAFTKPVVDSTAAINKCLEYAKLWNRWVQFGVGTYFASNICVPDGTRVEGMGIGDFGGRQVNDMTVFRQLPGANCDFIDFRCTYSLGNYRVTGIILRNFIIRGTKANTIGNGISFSENGTDKTLEANHAIINGTHLIENIFIREFPENGMLCKRGGVPAYIRHINCQYNGGYGIRWEGTSLNRNVVFENIDGDGNRGGAAIYVAGASYSNVSIYNTRCEYKDNSAFGVTPGFVAAQPYVVEIGNMTADSVVNIYGAYGNEYNTPEEAVDAVILVNCTANNKIPVINFTGISSLAGSGGNQSSLYDKLNEFRVPQYVRSGTYTRSSAYSGGTLGPVARVAIGDTGEHPGTSILDSSLIVRGYAPGIGAYEVDAAAGQRGFEFTNLGGSFQGRMTDGTLQKIFLSISKNANAEATFAEWFTNTFRVTGINSGIHDIKHANAGADLKSWRFKTVAGLLGLYPLTDANAEGGAVIEFLRSLGQPSAVRFPSRIIQADSTGAIPTFTTPADNFSAASTSIAKLVNTSNANLHYITSGSEGQMLTVIFDGFTTVKHLYNTTAAYIFLSSGRDFKPAAGQAMRFVREGNYWREVGGLSLQGYVTGGGAPSINAVRIGEEFYDASARTFWKAINTGTGATDWKQITN